MTYTFHIYEKENQDDPCSSFTVQTRDEAITKFQPYLEDAFHVCEDHIVYAGGWATCSISSSEPNFTMMSLLTEDQFKLHFT